jgi:hypothetical protein
MFLLLNQEGNACIVRMRATTHALKEEEENVRV